MYIISGKLKKRKLANCKTKTIRPAMAVVRKSIFDSLSDFVVDADVLDLCAGSGILGIEAISRGAKNLTLVDADRDSVGLINKNLELCKISARVIMGKLPGALKRLKNEQFDLIFIDPPYGNSSFITIVLEIIELRNFLKPNGLISIETESRSNYKIPESFCIFKEKNYGNTKVIFLKELKQDLA